MCGIVGVFEGDEENKAVKHLFPALYQLQHRAQDGAGIISCDGKKFFEKKGPGLVSEIIKENLETFEGHIAIGHVRYKTTSSVSSENIQPFLTETPYGKIAIAHNGEFPFANEENGNEISDTKIFLDKIKASEEKTLIGAIKTTCLSMPGAYSMIVLTPQELIAFRDPMGFRPLLLGRVDTTWIVASETCALDIAKARLVCSIKRGQLLVINKKGIKFKNFLIRKTKHFCIFEKVYYSRPDSNIDNEECSMTRHNLGINLAKEHPVEADCIIPIPDSGNWAALGFAKESRIDYCPALIRNHYINRVFIENNESIRQLKTSLKHNPAKSWFWKKKIVLVDDSIVRFVTMKKIIELISSLTRVEEIHVRISCPPIISPCFFGIDTKTTQELYARNHNKEEMIRELGPKVKSLEYLSMQGMLDACGDSENKKHCTSCFTGEYPMPVPLKNA